MLLLVRCSMIKSILALVLMAGCQHRSIVEISKINKSLVVLKDLSFAEDKTFLVCEDLKSHVKKVFVVPVSIENFSVGDTYTILLDDNVVKKICFGESTGSFLDQDVLYED